MAKANLFGDFDELPKAVNVEEASTFKPSKRVGEEIPFEEVGEADDDGDLIDPIDEGLKKKFDKALADELGGGPEEEDDAEEAEIDEDYDDEDDTSFDEFLEADFIIDMLEDLRLWGYPKLFEYAVDINDVVKYRKILSLKENRTPEELTTLKKLLEYEDAYKAKKDKFEKAIPWKEKYKAKLTSYLDYQLNRLFENKNVPVILIICLIEAFVIARIFMAKSSMPDMDFDIPDFDKK